MYNLFTIILCIVSQFLRVKKIKNLRNIINHRLKKKNSARIESQISFPHFFFSGERNRTNPFEQKRRIFDFPFSPNFGSNIVVIVEEIRDRSYSLVHPVSLRAVVILLGVSCVVLERLEDGRWCLGDVTTLGLESVLVSHVVHLDNFTVRRGEGVTTLGLLDRTCLRLGAHIVNVSDFLRLDAIRRLVAVTVTSIWIWTVQALPQNGNGGGVSG